MHMNLRLGAPWTPKANPQILAALYLYDFKQSNQPAQRATLEGSAPFEQSDLHQQTPKLYK